MKIKNGCTRMVFLIGEYAIKIPQIKYGWILFLKGLLCNKQESQLGKMGDKRMAPVLWASWGGWILVMPRCKELSSGDFGKIRRLDYHPITEIPYRGNFKIPVEFKKDSFGWLSGNIVAIDYGS